MESGTITTWSDCDQTLCQLRILDAKIESVGARHDRIIATAQERKAAELDPLVAERAGLDSQVLTYVGAQSGRLPKGKKSYKLTHGVVGFRKGKAAVVVADEESTIKALRAQGLLQCIVTKETLEKAELLKLDDVALAACGVTVTRKERAYYELTETVVAEPGGADVGE